MPTEPKNDNESVLDRVLRERLEQYKVPAEVRAELAAEIKSVLSRPERAKYGAAVMTPEASLAADKARERGARKGDAKPRIF